MSKRINWSAKVSPSEMKRRASGRRRFNRMRQIQAEYRRKQVAELMLGGITSHAEIGRMLKVDPSTVTRDIQKLFKALAKDKKCPVCGGKYQVVLSDFRAQKRAASIAAEDAGKKEDEKKET